MTKTNNPDEQAPDIDEKKLVPKKLLKKPLLIALFVLINVAVIAITAMFEFGNSKNAAKLSDVKINWWFLIPAALCFIVAITVEIRKYVLMMWEMSGDKEHFNFRKARKVARRTSFLESIMITLLQQRLAVSPSRYTICEKIAIYHPVFLHRCRYLV